MMIFGIGTDIIEIERVKSACKNQRFITRNFTERERQLFNQTPHLIMRIALHFAIKEAVVKAMGTGFRKINLIDIEVLRDDLGKPYLAQGEVYKRRLKTLGISRIFVSGSHCNSYATGYAIAEREENDEL